MNATKATMPSTSFPVRHAPRMSSTGLLGMLPEMRDDPIGLFLRAREAHGDVVRLRLGPYPAMFIYHPDHVHHVLAGNAANYAKQTRGYQMLRLVVGNGLVTSEGSFWKRQRRIAQPAFHRERIAGFHDVFVRASEDVVARWTGASGPIDVAQEMNRLTLRIAGETLFGVDLSGDQDEVGQALTVVLHRFNDLVGSAMPWPELWPTKKNREFRAAMATMDRVVGDIIAERRKDPRPRNDLLAMFMEVKDEDTGESMSDAELRDEVMTMLLAGHETTANALAWTFWHLSKHPDVGRRLAAELDTVLGDRPSPGLEHVRALTYTGQVLNESMRLNPPVWALARKAVEDDEIGGYHVPKGTFVFMSQYAIHRHPDLWENPEGFDPDRFAGKPSRPRYAYFPFSGGQRQCIGDMFAQMEAVVVLSVLWRRFRFDLVPGHEVVPEPSVTLRPKYGVRMTLAAR